MITLKTLSTATDQEVFDQVKNHLLTQNQRSVDVDGENCRYRGYDSSGNVNLKCAAGILIADDEYNPKMEGKFWKGLYDDHFVSIDHMLLISRLQRVHDNFSPEEWPIELAKVAKHYNLKY